LVEVFDRIYTYPLLSRRALFRSLLFTTVVSAIFVFETTDFSVLSIDVKLGAEVLLELVFLPLLFNVFTDYLSLFVIRPVLSLSGKRPVGALVFGAAIGAATVWAVNLMQVFCIDFFLCMNDVNAASIIFGVSTQPDALKCVGTAFRELHLWSATLYFVTPALVVFIWLPLFALGILIVRLWTPLSWAVGTTQWFLKEGKEHPLKAIGYVAAVVVFIVAAAGRAVIGAF
jgi:hypothetical protein